MILAGPFVNLMIAFLIIWVLLLSQGQQVASRRSRQIGTRDPRGARAQARRQARVGRRGQRLPGQDPEPDPQPPLRRPETNGCRAATPAQIVVRRNGQLVHVTAYPKYVAADKAPELGFAFDTASKPIGPSTLRGWR